MLSTPLKTGGLGIAVKLGMLVKLGNRVEEGAWGKVIAVGRFKGMDTVATNPASILLTVEVDGNVLLKDDTAKVA